MTCAEYRDRIEELLDGLLPPEEAGRFEAHVAECDECASRAEVAARFRALLADEGREAVGGWVADRLATRAAADAAAQVGTESQIGIELGTGTGTGSAVGGETVSEAGMARGVEPAAPPSTPARPVQADQRAGERAPAGAEGASPETSSPVTSSPVTSSPVTSRPAIGRPARTPSRLDIAKQLIRGAVPARVPSEIGLDTRPLTGFEADDTQEIPRGEFLPRTHFAIPRRDRFRPARLAAAAALVAAIGFFSAGLVGGSDVLALGAGVETRIESGQVASAGDGRTVSAEDRAVVLTLVADSRGAEFLMERGVGLFQADAGRPLSVSTHAGVARGVGASFIVDVRGDGGVAVGGVTGRVEFEREGTRTTLRSGERIEVDRRGRVRLVSRSQLDQLEVEHDLLLSEFQRMRDRLDDAEGQLVAYGAAAAQGNEGTPGSDGVLSVDELGRAARTLIDCTLGYRDAKRLQAVGVFLMNAERIQQEFGASDPMRAMSEPRFMTAISESFVRALAPDASEVAIASAVTEIHRANDDVLIAMDSQPLPAELGVARARAFTEILRALERHLGVDAAAEVARSSHTWVQLRPHVDDLDERVESRYVTYWTKQFTMDEAQSNELAVLVRNYIAETVRAQGVIASTLPPNQVEGALYPSWKRRGWGSSKGENGRSSADCQDPSADEPELSSSEVYLSKRRQTEARIQLAEPRVRFERALWDLLRSDQRGEGFAWGPRVHSFREVPVQ